MHYELCIKLKGGDDTAISRRKKKEKGIRPPVSAFERSQPRPFGSVFPQGVQESRLYYALREAVPLIDAAVYKTVRLVGGFGVRCPTARAQEIIDDFIMSVPVGGNRQGLSAFIESYLEQLLTCGTALGEIVSDAEGRPAALWNSPLEGIEFKRAENGFDIDIYVTDGAERKKVADPGLCLLSVLNPDPGALTGNSMLRGLPFVSDILLRIYRTIGNNWDRAGNLRFAVTYNPQNDPLDRAYAKERAMQIAEQWSQTMKPGKEVRDFVAVGDVQIKVIGAESEIPDSEVPVRQMLEQITAKTGLPPFMLGLSWSTTERMSSQQADALTSELEAYRRILTPVISKICSLYLSSRGESPRFEIIWDDITLQDEVEQSRARLYRAQSALIEEKLNNE